MPSAAQYFATMDQYERWCVYMGGTAFTTYEDNGEQFCRDLNELCRSWHAQGCPESAP